MGRRLTLEERERRWMWRGVVRIANQRQMTERSIEQARDVFGADGLMIFRPSPALAGPCSACSALIGQRHLVRTAVPLPLPDCDHPDQCGCLWQPTLDFDDAPQPTADELALAARLIDGTARP